MGNTSEKLKQHPLTLQEFVPPTRQKRSPVLTKMLMKVVRKIEEENYLTTPNPNFVPKFIFFDVIPYSTYQENDNSMFDKTQPLYGLLENAATKQEKNTEFKPDHNDSNSKVPTKASTQNSIADKPIQKPTSKENKTNNTASSSRTKPNTKPWDSTGQGPINAPKGSDAKGNKFFPAQNKMNTTKQSKKPLPSQNGKVEQNKAPLKANPNADNLKPISTQKNTKTMAGLLSPSNIEEDEYEGTNLGSNLEKLPAKKKLYINCELEKRLFSLPQKLQFEVMSFLINEYVSLILVSPIWYYKINELFENHLLSLDNSFIKTYMDIVAFKRSYFSIAPYRFSNKIGFRMDRNIVAEVLAPIVGKTVVISFTYELQRKKGVQYKAVYKFDVVRKGSRNVWIHKEESKPNFDESRSAFVQPIMPVCANDNIKLALNFYNLSGLVNINTIEWKSPIVEMIPSIPKELSSNFLEGIDRNRICEAEEINDEWFLYKYFERKNKVQYDLFDPQLALYETKCSGIDIVTNKTLYIAKVPGEVKRAPLKLGINIFVVGVGEEVVTEIKRFGLYQDLENFIQLRVGDRLTLYLTKGE